MTAIAGMVDWGGRPPRPVVARATALLARHGRDGEVVWDDGPVSFGWRRTLLFDEDQVDHQPQIGGAGRFVLVADVRIDNRAEIIRKLTLEATAAAWPDSRLLLASWEKWRERCVDHLAGAFAFAVWDTVERRLFLARDHVGTRPLFFWHGQGCCVFATMPSALFAHDDIPREIDEQYLVLSLCSLPRDPASSAYREISRVPAGQSVTVTAEGWRAERYWKPEDLPPLTFARDDDYVEAFHEIFDEAVRSCLRGIHPVGSHLSSGWDSATVTATAARLLAAQNRRLTAFTAVPPLGWKPAVPVPGELADEGPMAGLVAARFPNIDHVLIHGPERWELDALDRYSRDYEHPRIDINNVGWWENLHLDARHRGIRVMLMGGLGNQTISYDGIRLLPALARRLRFLDLAAHCAGLRASGMSWLRIIRIVVGPFLPDFARDQLLRTFRRYGISSMYLWPIRSAITAERGLEQIVKSPAVSDFLSHAADRRALWIRMARFDAGLFAGGMLAAADIDLRDPTADRRVMEFCRAIPEEQFINRGRTRWLLRRAMSGILPPELLVESRRGRQAANWYDAAQAASADIAAELDRIGENTAASAFIDVERLQSSCTTWAPEEVVLNPILAHQRILLQSAVVVGRFIRRFQGSNE